MKVLVGIAVVAVLAALATNWLRHRGETYLHHQFDTALPSQVEAHPWAPVRHGRSVPANAVVPGRDSPVKRRGLSLAAGQQQGG